MHNKEWHREYYKKNKSKIIERSKKAHMDNRDKKLEYQKNYREKRGRELHLKYRFGLDMSSYNDMSEKQSGLCAICGLPEISKFKGKLKHLAVDHNHNTGEIRGLLCSNCNEALGKLKVDNFGTLNLLKAIEYLKGDFLND